MSVSYNKMFSYLFLCNFVTNICVYQSYNINKYYYFDTKGPSQTTTLYLRFYHSCRYAYVAMAEVIYQSWAEAGTS